MLLKLRCLWVNSIFNSLLFTRLAQQTSHHIFYRPHPSSPLHLLHFPWSLIFLKALENMDYNAVQITRLDKKKIQIQCVTNALFRNTRKKHVSKTIIQIWFL